MEHHNLKLPADDSSDEDEKPSLPCLLSSFPFYSKEEMKAKFMETNSRPCTTLTGVAVSSKGDIVAIDNDAKQIRCFDAKGVVKNSIDASETEMPWDLFCTGSGKIGVIDLGKSEVKVFSKKGKLLTTSEWGSHLVQPCGAAYSHMTGEIAITDQGTVCVYIHDASGIVRDVCKLDSVNEKQAIPSYICFGHENAVMVSDEGNKCMYGFRGDGDLHFVYGSYRQQSETPGDAFEEGSSGIYSHGSQSGVDFSDLSDKDSDDGSPQAYVLPPIQSASGTKNEGVKNVSIKKPCGLCSDHHGNIYLADSEGHRIHKITKDGEFIEFTLIKQNGIRHPQAITMDQQGHLVVAEGNSGLIKIFQISSDTEIG